LSESRRGKSEPAIAALQKAVNLAPETFQYQKELGSKLSDERRYDEAIEYLRKAEKLKPNDFETKATLGVALMESGKFDEALEVLAQADRMKPGNQLIQMFLNVARARREGATQIELMKQVATQNPKDARVRESLSKMLLYLRRSAEAEAVLNELIPLLPQDGQSQNLVAVFYTDLGKLEKAIEYYRKATAIKPHHVIYLSLAGSLQKLGLTSEALEAYKKAFEIKPDSIYVLKLYADFLRDQGKRQEAIEMYKRAVEAEPTNSPVLFNLALLYVKTGNLELAKTYYEMLRAVDPPQAKTLNRFLRAR
jgi:tetratricopeptide (TPR) repeat protein